MSGCKCAVTRSAGWWCWVQRHGKLCWVQPKWAHRIPSWILLPPFEKEFRRNQLRRRGQNALRFWNAISYDEIFKGLVLDPEAMDGHGMSWAAALLPNSWSLCFLGSWPFVTLVLDDQYTSVYCISMYLGATNQWRNTVCFYFPNISRT